MSAHAGARHVLMTVDAVGGVWQYALDLANALSARGDEVTLALLGPALAADQRAAVESLAGLRLVETGLPLDWLASGPEPVAHAARAVSALATQVRADLVHCNAPALAAGAEFAQPLVAVAHGCVATWWQATRGAPLAPSFQWHHDMVHRGLRAAAAVVAPSAAHAADVQRAYALPRLPMVVHNGRRRLPGAQAAADPLAAAFTVGRLWDEAKNTAVLDHAAELMRAPFLAAGALAGPHGEHASVHHLEPLGQLGEAQLAALLARRPVFVSAARFEPFGLAVLEAAMAGCPLVLSDIPTFRELWDGAALFVAADDAAAFARAADDLIADLARRHALGAAAQARAARYTPEACAAAMVTIYDRLPGQRQAAA